MEGLGNPVKLELSLSRLSMTSIITNIYEHPVIKKKMKRIINTSRIDEKSFPFKPLKNAIYQVAIKILKRLNLSKKLMLELEGMALIFAKKLVCLADYIVRVVGLDISYLDAIYWKSIGTIDETKMFHTYWTKHGGFTKILRRGATNNFNISRSACIYVHKEAILKFQNPMIKEVQNSLGRVRLPQLKNNVDQILATYLCYLHGDTYDFTIGENLHFRFIHSGKIEIEDVIFVCAREGLVEPTKYFWNLLNNDQKERIVSKLAFTGICGELLFAEILSEEDKYEEIFRVRGAEQLYFLIINMKPEQRNEFLKNYSGGIIKLFLMVWPYQEICLKILDEEWIPEMDSDDRKMILHQVLFRMVEDELHESCVYQKLFYEILRKAMRIVNKEEKDEILFHYGFPSWGDVEAIEKFYERFDVAALSIIINDKDLEGDKDFMIAMGGEKFQQLKKENNLELLIRFMEKVLISNEERKSFIENYELSSLFLNVENLNIREKMESLGLV